MGGRVSTEKERQQTLVWANNFLFRNSKEKPSGLDELKKLSKRYFALAAASRNKKRSALQRKQAEALVFDVRVKIEKMVNEYLQEISNDETSYLIATTSGKMFGCSKKQGVSLRLPLSSCVPSKLCRSACYAHDALDATPNSLIRGAINGHLAAKFEEQNILEQQLNWIDKQIKISVRQALVEAESKPFNYSRKARIRLAHVGEATAYPKFANYLSKKIKEISDNQVDIIVYTRHPDAHLLDEKGFTLLFSLDSSSLNRRVYAPSNAKVTFADFGNTKPSDSFEIVFKEHHPNEHTKIDGDNICPVSIRKSGSRSCDEARCSICFAGKI